MYIICDCVGIHETLVHIPAAPRPMVSLKRVNLAVFAGMWAPESQGWTRREEVEEGGGGGGGGLGAAAAGAPSST